MTSKWLRRTLFVTSFFILGSYPLHAGAGRTACQFLKLNPSARSAAMGGAAAAAGDGVFSAYANPAALSAMEKGEFGATYMRYFADIDYGYVGYAAPFRKNSTLGFGYTYLIVKDIERRDTAENLSGSFNARDTAFTASFATRDAAPSILENLDAGLSVRLISSEIDQTVAYAVAADAGSMYRITDTLTATLSLLNIGPGIKFSEETDPLPLDLRFGVAYRRNSALTLGADIDEYLIDGKCYAAAGAEYRPAPQFALRGGYRFGYDTASLGSNVGLSLGVGFRIWSAGLDYAFVPFGDLGDTHRVTFTARF